MRVYEAKIIYSLISLGESITLDTAEKVTRYLQSAFDENPMQETFYAVYLDRKNHPIGRHLITIGTLTSTLVGMREVFRLLFFAHIVVWHSIRACFFSDEKYTSGP